MPYCRVCHKSKSEQHFEDYPDHRASGPKRTLAQIAERGDRESGEESEGGGWLGLAIAGAAGLGIVGLAIWSAIRGAAGGLAGEG